MKDILRILLLTMMVCCWSCSGGEDDPIPTPTPKPEEKPKIEVTTTAPVLAQEGGTASVTFSSTADWTIDVTEGRAVSWCTVSPTSGSKGTNTLTITTTDNDTYDERNAKVTIKAGATTQSLTVTQKQKDALTVTSNKVEIGSDGGNFSIEAKSNVTVTYEIEESAKDWISAGESRGLTTKTLNFTAKANDKTERRQGTITLKGGDGLTETVTVYQEGEAPGLVLTTEKEMTVDSEGGTLKIELKSNQDVMMEAPEANWLRQSSSRAMSDYTYYIEVDANETYDERNAAITFTSGDLKETVTITQKQKDALTVTSNKVELKAEGGDFTIEAQANVSVSYEIEEAAKEWISAVESRALNATALHFTAKANDKTERRQGTITLKGGDGLTETVTVYQEGEAPGLVLTTEKEMTVDSEGGTLKIELKSNQDVMMEAPEANWLRQSSSRAMSDYTYYIEVDANETYDERNAAITFTSGDLKETVTITQKQKDALTVTSNKVELKAEGGDFTIEAQANVSVSYEIEEAAKEWISAVESRALNATALHFTAKANDKTERRQGNIILKGGDGLTETVTVYQEGEAPSLVISSDDLVVKSEGETVQIEVKSNIDYTMVLPDVNWISKDESRTISTYTHYLTIDPNDTYDPRSAMVYFQSETANLKDSIRIMQLQQDALIVAKNEYEVKGEGDTLTFKVQANVELDITLSDDWITRILPESRALTEHDLSFVIAGNPDWENGREGIITIKDANSDLKQVITVKQPAYVPELVKMEYRPGWTWEEAHDNLPLLYYAHVDRDRYYSNGEVYTDHFVDYGHDARVYCSVKPMYTGTEEMYPSTKTEVYTRQEIVNEELITYKDSLTYTCASITENDSIRIIYYNVEVNNSVDLSTLKTGTSTLGTGATAGDWENYVVSKLYTETAYNQSNNWNFAWMSFDPSTTANGWYFKNVSTNHYCKFYFNNKPSCYFETAVCVEQYDQFLVIDGHMVDFTDYYPDRTDNVTVEDIAGGKKVTHECTVKYLGRNFYSAVITNIYQR